MNNEFATEYLKKHKFGEADTSKRWRTDSTYDNGAELPKVVAEDGPEINPSRKYKYNGIATIANQPYESGNGFIPYPDEHPPVDGKHYNYLHHED